MRCKRLLSFALAAALLFGSAALVPEDEFSSETSITASATSRAISGKCGKNVRWTLSDDGVLTISGTGKITDFALGGSPFYQRTDIKSVVIKSGITSIGYSTFADCPSLTSVTIPSSVTSIGEDAFWDCKNLKSVIIPKSVTSIGDWAFYNCKSLTSIDIPNGVTSIGNNAFFDCKNLKSVIIPKSVTSIDNSAFSGCSSLTSVTIPSSVTSIGNYAFSGCSSLTSITIPSSVTSIGNNAFFDCKNLKSVIIPKSVTSIGEEAFSLCTNLTSITIPNSVTSIGDYAFSGCTSLKSITIPSSVKSIGYEAFYNCTSLTSVTTSIRGEAFKGTKWLENQQKKNPLVIVNGILIDGRNCSGNVSIPNGVTSIGEGAFFLCTSLTSVTMQNGVKSIGEEAFSLCTNLTSITIPNSVTSVGKRAFSGCSSLTSVTIPSSVTSIGDYAFSGCTSLTSTSIRGEAFKGTKWLENQQKKNPLVIVNGILIDGKTCKGKVIIPSSVTSIGDLAFEDCTSLTSVKILSSVKSIGVQAFYECKNLTSVTIPNSVKSIGVQAFYECKNLTSVTIPSSVTSIDDHVFSGCTSLKSVTIPSSVKSIGDWAFSYCTNLTSITIPNSVTSIGDNAFYNCSSLTSVTIPNSVTSIGDSAFSGCENLTSVTIPNSVTSIGDAAFKVCSSLTSVTIPSSVTSIGNYAFFRSGLKSVTIPSSVTSIGEEAFWGCSGLTSVTIQEGVKSIGKSAFERCYILESITIPDSVTIIGDNAFWCSGLTSVTIPNSVEYIGNMAFGYSISVDGYAKIVDFTIYGLRDTEAERYAKDNGFKFVAISTTEPKTVRFAGANRYDTAALISKGMYKTADTVIIATGFDFHDALAAVPLASAYNAPLLLADRDNLSAKTLTEIKRLKAKNVIVVASTNAKDQNGKSAAIKSKVYKQLKGYNVTKLLGSSYYETAKKVAQQLQKKTGEAPNYVFFTTNRNYADALSVSPVAAILKAPIFYVDPKGRLNANTTYYLNSVKSSVKKVFIIGGTNAVSKDVVAKIKAVLPGKTVQRFAGADRYATCVRINNAFKSTLTGDSVCVAKGYNFPDALAGGVFAAKIKAPLFLADKLDKNATLNNVQKNYLKSRKPSKLYVFGGQTAVPSQLVKTVAKACV